MRLSPIESQYSQMTTKLTRFAALGFSNGASYRLCLVISVAELETSPKGEPTGSHGFNRDMRG